MKTKTYYKLARPDGWDFYTGKTINYRDNIGKIVSIPDKKNYVLCSDSVIHASYNPNDCFVFEDQIPCSAYEVEGNPVIESPYKCGFIKLKVIKEILDLDTLFGWKYSEAINPINPLKIQANKVTKKEIALIKEWASVRNSFKNSVSNSVLISIKENGYYNVREDVENSIWHNIGEDLWDRVWDSAWDNLWKSAGGSVRDSEGNRVLDNIGFTGYRHNAQDSIVQSIMDSIRAYMGSLFPEIKKWKYIRCRKRYPFQPAVELWKKGFIASFDEKKWRLHAGIEAKIVWEGKP